MKAKLIITNKGILKQKKEEAKAEQVMPIETLWMLVCDGNIKELKEYFSSEYGILNRRYCMFGKENSLIMGAFRNEELDTVEYLLNIGETVTLEEEKEILNELRRIDIMRRITSK